MSQCCAEAAAKVAAPGAGGLDLLTVIPPDHHAYVESCLHSRLLRTWASASLTCIMLDLRLCMGTPVLELVAAATHLKRVVLNGWVPAAPELADKLLAAAPRTTCLDCWDGRIMPTSLPPNLEQLELDTRLVGGGSVVIPDYMFYLLSQLPHLQKLTFHMGFQAKLCCPITCPRQLVLYASFCVSDHSPMQLQWLADQAYKSLELQIQVDTARASQHEAVVQMLRQHRHRFAEVTVVMDTLFTLDLQRIWAQVTDLS